MNNKIHLDVPTFNKEFTAFIDSIKERVVSKSREYSRGGDAFSNFNSATELKEVDARSVLDWYMTKHLVSYHDMMTDIRDRYNPTNKLSEEKLGDIIAYLGILHVMNCTKNGIVEDLPF